MNIRSLHWLLPIFGGVLIAVLGVYWWVHPLSIVSNLCLAESCVITLFIAIIFIFLGIGLGVTGVVAYLRSKKSQTVVITIDEEAEKDAADIEKLQEALDHHTNAEKVIGGSKKQAKESEVFMELPKDEIQRPAPKKKKKR
jgi:hypothetical protein